MAILHKKDGKKTQPIKFFHLKPPNIIHCETLWLVIHMVHLHHCGSFSLLSGLETLTCRRARLSPHICISLVCDDFKSFCVFFCVSCPQLFKAKTFTAPRAKRGMYQQRLDGALDQHWQSLCHRVSEKDTGVPFVNVGAHPESRARFFFSQARKRNYFDPKHSRFAKRWRIKG